MKKTGIITRPARPLNKVSLELGVIRLLQEPRSDYCILDSRLYVDRLIGTLPADKRNHRNNNMCGQFIAVRTL